MASPANTPVIMDARKFIKHINNGAGAKLKFFEETVERIGTDAGRPFRLASLDVNSLIFEDVEKNQYYMADIKKIQNGRIAIENVRPIQVIEAEKAEQFGKNVSDLVESIAKNEYREADKTFHKIETQRYRSHVIPESGLITTRDGIAHKVRVSSRAIKENHVPVIVKMFCEAVKDSVELDKGMVVRGVFSETQEKFTIPINEYTRRRLVARHMRDIAESAYKSKSFQDLVFDIATKVCDKHIDEAVKTAAKFLQEMQEFCMLDQKGFTTLVENALAARCEFNGMLAADAGALMYKVNSKVNRDTILEAWSKTAQKAENAALLTNVKVLEESAEFHKDYNGFLDIIFNEGADVASARARAYLASLKIISSVLPNLENEDGDKMSSVEELNGLIARLERPDPDTATILQAEELLTGISDSLLDRISTLESFDKMPSSDEDMEAGEEEDKTPVPLPEIEAKDDTGEIPPAETPAPGQAPGAPSTPPIPESVQRPIIEIEKMQLADLNEELEAWQLSGNNFLKEDGFADCHKQFDRYVARCLALGPTANQLREQFEKMRAVIVETGDETIIDESDDYSNSVKVALEGIAAPPGGEASPLPPKGAIPGTLPRDNALEAADPVKPKSLPKESRIDRNYRHTLHEEMSGPAYVVKSGDLSKNVGLRMGDNIQSSGGSVQPKVDAVKSADGRKGDGVQAAQNYDAPSGQMKGAGIRMDDLQGQKSIQTGPVHGADGRKGDGAKAADDYGMKDKAIKDAGGLEMTDLQGEKVVGGKSAPDKSDGRAAGRTAAGGSRSKFMPVESVLDTGAKSAENYTVKGGDLSHNVGLDMKKEYQAKGGGVQKAGVTSADGRKGDGTKAADDYTTKGDLKPAKGGLSASAEFQGKASVQQPGVKSVSGDDGEGAPEAKSYTKEDGLKAGKDGPSELQGNKGVAEDIFDIERIAAIVEEMNQADGTAPMAEPEIDEEAPEEPIEDEGVIDEPAGEDIEDESAADEVVDDAAADTTLEVAQIAAAAATATAVAAQAVVNAAQKNDMEEHGEGEIESDEIGEELLPEPMPAEGEAEMEPEASPPEEEVAEDQRKGPSIKKRGFKRSSLAPAKEDKNAKGKTLQEDLAVFYTKDKGGQEVDQIIAGIVDAMNKEEGGEGLPELPPEGIDEMGDEGLGEEGLGEEPMPPVPAPTPEGGEAPVEGAEEPPAEEGAAAELGDSPAAENEPETSGDSDNEEDSKDKPEGE